MAVTESISCTLLRGQLSFARARGFDVGLLCSPGEAAERISERERATLLPVRMARGFAPLRDLIALGRICAALIRFRPDIVNAGTPKAGLLVMLAAWTCRVPCRIYTLRGLYLEGSFGSRREILRRIEQLTCALADRVLCVSQSLRRQGMQLGVLPDAESTVLGSGSSNGVDLERFAMTSVVLTAGRAIRAAVGADGTAVVVGFIGRLTRDKGLAELADAWARLRQEFKEVHLLVVGWPEDRRVSATVRKMQTDDRVHVVGPVAETPAYYAAMDLLVLPSYREGLPNVLLEAGAMQRPVVATAVTGCVDAVHDGVTGTLVPAGDAGALAAAVAAYVRNPGLRQRHGAAARARVECEFANVRVWAALHAEYLRLLDAAGIPLPRLDQSVTRERGKTPLTCDGLLAGAVVSDTTLTLDAPP